MASPEENHTRTKYDKGVKNLTVLANRSQDRPGAQYRMQVGNMVTVNFSFCPSKANSWRFKSTSCNRNEP